MQLKDIGRELEAVSKTVLRPLGVAITQELAVGVFNRAVRTSPVGTPATSEHPGKYRASHTLSRGPRSIAKKLPDAPTYAIPGENEARAAVKGLQPGERVHLVNRAKSDGARKSYAKYLEPPYTKSPQAPQGVYAPMRAWLQVNAG
ncbi:MAG: hypothetical protein AAFX50_07165, partial [Acidobacteriota bacterium]